MNENLRDTPEQKELFNYFRSSHRNQPVKRRACPCCCADYHSQNKKICGWEHGSSSIGSKTVRAFKCNNCSYIEIAPIRKEKIDPKAPTPAQQRSIQRIEAYFKARTERSGIEYKPEIELKHIYGNTWGYSIVVGRLFDRTGGHFFIGNLGSVRCAAVYDFHLSPSTTEKAKKHYERMLKR